MIKYKIGDTFQESINTVTIVFPALRPDFEGEQMYFCEVVSNINNKNVYVVYSEKKLDNLNLYTK